MSFPFTIADLQRAPNDGAFHPLMAAGLMSPSETPVTPPPPGPAVVNPQGLAAVRSSWPNVFNGTGAFGTGMVMPYTCIMDGTGYPLPFAIKSFAISECSSPFTTTGRIFSAFTPILAAQAKSGNTFDTNAVIVLNDNVVTLPATVPIGINRSDRAPAGVLSVDSTEFGLAITATYPSVEIPRTTGFEPMFRFVGQFPRVSTPYLSSIPSLPVSTAIVHRRAWVAVVDIPDSIFFNEANAQNDHYITARIPYSQGVDVNIGMAVTNPLYSVFENATLVPGRINELSPCPGGGTFGAIPLAALRRNAASVISTAANSGSSTGVVAGVWSSGVVQTASRAVGAMTLYASLSPLTLSFQS